MEFFWSLFFFFKGHQTNALFLYLFFFSPPFRLDLITDFTFSTGQRGCEQLVFRDYTFVKNSMNGLRTIWKCSRKVSLFCYSFFSMSNSSVFAYQFQSSRKCRAKVITDVRNNVMAIVRIKECHNHAVNIKRSSRSQSQKSCTESYTEMGQSETEYVDDDDYDFLGSE